MHPAVLDAEIAGDVDKANRASLRLIAEAGADIDEVLWSRRSLPSLSAPATLLKGIQAAEDMACKP